MKKIIKLIAFVLIMSLAVSFGIMLSGCAFGVVPEAEQLHGRWYLTEHEHRPENTTHRPGSIAWSGGYFIEFRADGTFSEFEFWTAVVEGTWELDGDSLTLNWVSGTSGLFGHVTDRTIRISEDGNTIVMTYSRNIQGVRYRYTDTFERASE